MKPDMIDRYRKIQHRKGEWRFGDIGLDIELGRFVVTWSVTGYTGMEVHWEGDGQPGALQKDDPDLLWLPPVWSEDGRCLCDMIERDFSVTRIWYDSDDLTTDDGWIYGVDFIDGEFIGYYNSLPEALLRAIKEQEGKG